MIDLHMHTTASDGRLTPAELVGRAAAAGLTTISVTDHDTVAAIDEVTAAAESAGIRVIPGIEITSVDSGRDVHMLGYLFDQSSEKLLELLVKQRALRVSRVREIADRLAALGMFVDADSVIAAAASRPGSSVGRPQLARALVRAGHVASVQQAFDQWLATGCPAFVPRTGPSPAMVIDAIHEAGGVASFAHPGVTKRDDLIAPLIDRGLDAIEAYHSDHTPEDVAEYRNMAIRFNALVSGGSDFHGEDPASAKATGGKPGQPGRRHRSTFGVICLPPAALAALEQRAHLRQAAKP
ncbi:MAG: PHP domain-containing protein [Acidobacteriota bacterium]